MQARSCSAVLFLNSRQKRHGRDCASVMLLILAFIVLVSAGDPGTSGPTNLDARTLRPAFPSAAAYPDAASDHDARLSQVSAGSASHAVSHHHGRRLRQTGYDPYGIGYYDPYQSGVTPGFVNVDLNRETGLHVDVGTVAVDVSADKNYYGLGVGNLVGVGAAKDRGWNLQLGGGNIVDVSVTKDAGLGLWLLNGLANIQIGPDGRGWETGHIAAQNVPGQQPAAAAAETTATTATPAGQASQQVTSVVVDEAHPDSSTGQPTAGAADGVVHAASETPAAAVEEPIITEEPINLSLTASASEPIRGAVPPSAAGPRSSAARRSRPPTYVEPRPPTYVQTRPGAAVSDSDAVVLPVSAQSSEMTPEAPASPPDVTAWGSAPTPQLPTHTATAPHSIVRAQTAALGTTAPVQPVVAAAVAAAPMPRRACEGGAMVAVAGNKFKCRYRRTRQAASPNDVRTYPSGAAV